MDKSHCWVPLFRWHAVQGDLLGKGFTAENRNPKLHEAPELAFQGPSDSRDLNVQVIRFAVC